MRRTLDSHVRRVRLEDGRHRALRVSSPKQEEAGQGGPGISTDEVYTNSLEDNRERNDVVFRAFSLGTDTDHCSEWPAKLLEVRQSLFKNLPFSKATELYDLYLTHVNARRGNLGLRSEEDRVYRKILEFEEALLMFEELKVCFLKLRA